MKFYFKAGFGICGIGSVSVIILVILLSEPICVLFGAEGATLEYILRVLPQFAVGFIAMSFNVLISAYMYSTERSLRSTIVSILRSGVVSSAVILLLPKLFGADIIWFTFLIYEAIVLVVAIILLRNSERNGIVFK